MEQQTAVEWLIWELERCGYFEINDHFPITFEQAKKMEKEQIMDAFLEGKVNHSKDWAIEYYNETYERKS